MVACTSAGEEGAQPSNGASGGPAQFKNELASTHLSLAEQLEATSELKTSSARAQACMVQMARGFMVATRAAQLQKQGRLFARMHLVGANAEIVKLEQQLEAAETQVRDAGSLGCCTGLTQLPGMRHARQSQALGQEDDGPHSLLGPVLGPSGRIDWSWVRGATR